MTSRRKGGEEGGGVGGENHLHVERSSDLEPLGDLEDDVAETEEDIPGHVAGREDERSVSRVDATLSQET